MRTYIIRGWKKEALAQHEFAHREANRGNDYSIPNYYAKPEEFRFKARGDSSARKKTAKEHPELTECRELLEVIPL